ncbi:hypothetical protein [Desulfonatronospira sp.]|uniref:class I SAM-dependent RNA methyltransferase n=1 Tax=Desulfonatronospira sp. TaxID=1962951 RepID=UPI0025BFB412|nr:hypothetical protein [Desulfonatronospira sp.]
MQELELTVERLIWRGRALARLKSGRVVILEPGVFPGERILAQITKSTRDHFLARCTRILEQTEYRQEHPCTLGDLCGGCRFGVLPYQVQVLYKHQVLHSEIRRALGRKWSGQAPDEIQVFSSPESWGYRWRGQTEVVDGRPHVKALGRNDPLHCPSCLLHAPVLARDLLRICRELPRGRYTVAASPLDHKVLPHTSQEWLKLPLNNFGVSLQLRPGSFFQANWRLNQDLVDYVHARLSHLERIADLYAGAGNFALACAAKGQEVLALESDPQAAQGTIRAAKKGGLHNLGIHTGDLRRRDAMQAVKKFGPQGLILDPPRSGRGKNLQSQARLEYLQRLVWISCDVVNTCRDLTPYLEASWRIREAAMFDMFPQTWHMEVVFVLEKS